MSVHAKGTTFFQAGADGSFVLTAGNAVAVDMSGASGTELVVVTADFKDKKSKKKKKNNKNNKAEASPIQHLSMTIGETTVPIK